MARRPVVTLHFPLEMGMVGEVLLAVSRAYPDAVMGQDGEVLADPDDPARFEHRAQVRDEDQDDDG